MFDPNKLEVTRRDLPAGFHNPVRPYLARESAASYPTPVAPTVTHKATRNGLVTERVRPVNARRIPRGAQ